MEAEVSRVRAQDLLDSIFRVATELVRGERASLMLRADNSTDFVISRAIGLADEVRRQVRVREGEGVAGRVVASKRGLLVRGAAGEAPDQGSLGDYRTRSFVSVPIVVGDDLRGLLNVADPLDERGFGQSDLEMLELLARHIGACLVQQEEGETLHRLAETDPLTWLFNRRHFDRRIAAETNRAMRGEHLLALLVVDVDGFKSINDRYGHQVGDQVLKGVATALTQAVRLYDVPTRYGGDEFAILLPEADTEAATRVARRILDKTAALPLPEGLVASGERIRLSIGIATFPRPSTDAVALVGAADSAMYNAKEAGGGIRVWEHAFADGPRGRLSTQRPVVVQPMPAPYLADPARLATSELQRLLPAGVAAEWNAVVVGQEGQVLTIAMPAPSDAAVDSLSKASGYAIYPVYSGAADLEATRRRLIAS
ncbi:MAG: diguanylate cyclase [Chloroflexota bacterium]|nr:diguanylate cyclase [Chloroflexota bacterium]